jgi:predicted enzyme related to lactoylglutathione lyase
MSVQSVAFIVMPVSDMSRARKFYEGELGLCVETAMEGFVEYDVNGVTVAVADAREWRSFPPGEGMGIAFEVDNVDAMVERLTAAGAPLILPAFDTPVCRMAGLKDPDGNRFVVHQCRESNKS